MDKNKALSILAKRAHLSMAGKAVLGLVFGTILTILGFFRRAHDKDVLEEINKPKTWAKMEITDPPCCLKNNSYFFKHYSALGVDSVDAIYLNQYIKDMTAKGALLFELDSLEIDSVNKLLRIDTQWVFRVDDLKGQSFILVVKDKKIQNIVSCHPIDSVIYPFAATN